MAGRAALVTGGGGGIGEATLGSAPRRAPRSRSSTPTPPRLGALHTLVNVAGVRVYTPLAEATPADWELILGVNVLRPPTAARPHCRRCARRAAARS